MEVAPMSKEEAENLLKEITGGMAGIVELSENRYENKLYYLYIGKFPQTHVAIDNKAGTSRLFSFYCYQDYLDDKNRISFVNK